ncbi:regulator [Streptomyces sp. NPDC052299]|uniref:regulator n=1 Tax=Streptomyces sp. NPDC052299 TaxID=3155054 RepID=UPI0034495F95
MTTTAHTPAAVRQAVDLLASRSLIRLVSEIDDHGAIPPRRLASTLTDLSTHHLRRAAEVARAHGLIRIAPGSGLELTDSGTALADLYDAFARWDRHHYPAPVCAFTERVRRVFDVAVPSLMSVCSDDLSGRYAERLPSAEVEAELGRPRALLVQWLADNPQATEVPEPGMAA